MGNSKMKLTSRFVLALAIITLQLTNVGAVTAQGARTEPKLPFCQNIDSVTAGITAGIEGKKMPQYNKISGFNPELDSKRAEADTMRSQHFEKIVKKYNTPGQARAIAEYKQTVQDAVAKRRSAVDTARQEFKDAANALQATHHQAVAQAEQNLLSSIEIIIAKAKTDCSDDIKPEIARDGFKAALVQARAEFRASVGPQPNQQQALNLLIATRKQAIDLAIAEFRQIAYDAKERLLLTLSL